MRSKSRIFAVGLSLAIAAATPAAAASLTQSVHVKASPAEVWAAVGPFCAISQWHPAIGSCADDGRRPPTRTLVTKDGQATFVELEIARSERQRSYAYTFLSAPVPVTRYRSTLQVVGQPDGTSTVVWRGVFTPDPGKAKDADAALRGIYRSGLDAIKSRFPG